MTPEGFVDAIRRHVIRSAASGIISRYRDPPGRRPDKGLVELSRWYNALPDSDQAMVARVAKDAAFAAAFGFLCVLDGVRVVEDPEDRGEFELWHVKDETRQLLASSSQFGDLHDLLGAVEPSHADGAAVNGDGGDEGE